MSPGSPSRASTRPRPLRLGFLALTDAAPLIVAQETGCFARRGLRVELRREIGWATIRAGIVDGTLDAAHAPAPMLWAVELGLDGAPTHVLTALVLNRHGNAMTLAERLWREGVRDAAGLAAAARLRRGESRLTLGVVYRYSSHHLHLRRWLEQAGVDPEQDVRIVVVPPAQMGTALRKGAIDGFWAGEPWTSLAVADGEGWCMTWSARFAPRHLEKALLVTEAFANRRPEEHLALVGALQEAASWCTDPKHHTELVAMLGARAYLNLPSRVLLPALTGQFDRGHGQMECAPDFLRFGGDNTNIPTAQDAAALQAELTETGILPPDLAPELPARLFREDLYHAAVEGAVRSGANLRGEAAGR